MLLTYMVLLTYRCASTRSTVQATLRYVAWFVLQTLNPKLQTPPESRESETKSASCPSQEDSHFDDILWANTQLTVHEMTHRYIVLENPLHITIELVSGFEHTCMRVPCASPHTGHVRGCVSMSFILHHRPRGLAWQLFATRHS